MNPKQFEEIIRSEMSAKEVPLGLNSRISRELAKVQGRRRLIRRFTFAISASAAATFILVALPTVNARAGIQRMAGALDNVHSVVLTDELIGRDGSKRTISKMSYLDGRWKMEGISDVTYYVNGITYSLPKNGHNFISDKKPQGPFAHNEQHLSLSSFLGEIRQWQPKSTVTMDQADYQGRKLNRATITEENGSRTLMWADPSNDLPVAIEQLRKRNNKWTIVEQTKLDYASPLKQADFVPDFKTYPAIDKETFDRQMVASVTQTSKGELKLPHGRLIVRAVDVAPNGTVFVACQSGERIARWDRGYPLEIASSDGTQYGLMEIESSEDQAFIDHSNDGKLEVCVFVPLEPLSVWHPFDLKIVAHMNKAGKLEKKQIAYMSQMHAKNGIVYMVSRRWYYDRDKPTTLKTVASIHVDKPTVDVSPGYLQLVQPFDFRTDSDFRRAEAQARADEYRELDQPNMEAKWIEEVMRLDSRQGNPAPELRLQELKEVLRTR